MSSLSEMFCRCTWRLTHPTAVQMRMEVELIVQWKIIIGDRDLVPRGLIMPDHLHQPFLEQCFTGRLFIRHCWNWTTTIAWTVQRNSLTCYWPTHSVLLCLNSHTISRVFLSLYFDWTGTCFFVWPNICTVSKILLMCVNKCSLTADRLILFSGLFGPKNAFMHLLVDIHKVRPID